MPRRVDEPHVRQLRAGPGTGLVEQLGVALPLLGPVRDGQHSAGVVALVQLDTVRVEFVVLHLDGRLQLPPPGHAVPTRFPAGERDMVTFKGTPVDVRTLNGFFEAPKLYK